jgi:hypothetical protein
MTCILHNKPFALLYENCLLKLPDIHYLWKLDGLYCIELIEHIQAVA